MSRTKALAFSLLVAFKVAFKVNELQLQRGEFILLCINLRTKRIHLAL